MDCPHCRGAETRRLRRTTDLGYPVFRCQGCDRSFNERTGTPFNFVEVPTEIIFQVLLCRVRYQLDTWSASCADWVQAVAELNSVCK